MKTLYIIRHAKSSWEFDDLHDLERPLTEKGRKDALLMGGLLRKKNIHPAYVMSSPALRAVSTCRIICDEIGFDKNKMEIYPDLYFRDVADIIALIHRKGARHDSIFIFGHNPTFTNLGHTLAPEFNDMIPTCGIVALNFDAESWGLIEEGNGKLVFFEYPKKYR